MCSSILLTFDELNARTKNFFFVSFCIRTRWSKHIKSTTLEFWRVCNTRNAYCIELIVLSITVIVLKFSTCVVSLGSRALLSGKSVILRWEIVSGPIRHEVASTHSIAFGVFVFRRHRIIDGVNSLYTGMQNVLITRVTRATIVEKPTIITSVPSFAQKLFFDRVELGTAN